MANATVCVCAPCDSQPQDESIGQLVLIIATVVMQLLTLAGHGLAHYISRDDLLDLFRSDKRGMRAQVLLNVERERQVLTSARERADAIEPSPH